MRRFASAICILLSFLSLSFAASAANHTVTVGGNGLIFTPKVLTVTAGDTVTFTNAGGFHNVAADDGSFRCASDCTSAGGDASSGAWSFQVTYNAVGTFGYHCEIHGGPAAGMYGNVIVQAATAPTGPALGGGLSGNWYDPAQSGSGFQLEFTSNADTLVAIWFVFAPDGTPQWIYGQGTFDPTTSTVTVPAQIEAGGSFPFPASNYVPANISKTPWGTITFTFSDCNNATVAWNSTVAGYGSGSLPLTRLTTIAGTTCQ